MAVLVASGSAISVAANVKSGDQIGGQYQYGGKGIYTLVARSSATGMTATFNVGGISIVSDLPIVFTGTAGAMSTRDHVIASQMMAGGRVELFLRNTTAGALTTDYQVWFDAAR